MPTTPADVIARTLRRAGVPQADIHARAIAADLAGHGWLADNGPAPTRRAKPADAPKPKCQAPDDPHSGTDLIGGRCPICQWTPTA